MTIDLASLGITPEELVDRVVNAAVESLLTGKIFDEDGDDVPAASTLANKMRELIRTRVDERVAALAEAHVLPRVAEMVETVSMQRTNQWGEKAGAPVGFIEYLAQRAESYLTEKVDFQGKSKDDDRGYSWSGSQSRITYLVDKHLQYSIETAMKGALATANGAIAGGIAETVKAKLAEIATGLQITVKTK